MLALALLLTMSACNDSDPRSEQVEPVAVPDKACDLVPADVVSDWDLTVSDESTSNRELLGFGRCVMSGPETSEVALDLSLTTYGGGDADSADEFAADERTDSCAELSATESARGVFGEDEQLQLTALQRRERRGAGLQGIHGVAAQQQGVGRADHTQATAQAIVAERRMRQHMQSRHQRVIT